MRQITLTRGKLALVDDEDFDLVSLYRWHARPVSRLGENWYAKTKINDRHVYMHRFLMGDVRGAEYDHANGNGLDNRRSNLRICSRSENCVNRQYVGRTGFRGVDVNLRRASPFRARLRFQGKVYFGDWTDDAVKAAKQYDQLALRHHGSFAHVNFGQQT